MGWDPTPGLHSAEDGAIAHPPAGLPLGITTPAPCHADPDAQGSSLQTRVWPSLARCPEDGAGRLPDRRASTCMGAEDQACEEIFQSSSRGGQLCVTADPPQGPRPLVLIVSSESAPSAELVTVQTGPCRNPEGPGPEPGDEGSSGMF